MDLDAFFKKKSVFKIFRFEHFLRVKRPKSPRNPLAVRKWVRISGLLYISTSTRATMEATGSDWVRFLSADDGTASLSCRQPRRRRRRRCGTFFGALCGLLESSSWQDTRNGMIPRVVKRNGRAGWYSSRIVTLLIS